MIGFPVHEALAVQDDNSLNSDERTAVGRYAGDRGPKGAVSLCQHRAESWRHHQTAVVQSQDDQKQDTGY